MDGFGMLHFIGLKLQSQSQATSATLDQILSKGKEFKILAFTMKVKPFAFHLLFIRENNLPPNFLVFNKRFFKLNKVKLLLRGLSTAPKVFASHACYCLPACWGGEGFTGQNLYLHRWSPFPYFTTAGRIKPNSPLVLDPFKSYSGAGGAGARERGWMGEGISVILQQ